MTINEERIPRNVIVIGASLGGIKAVIELLSRLPSDLPGIVGVVIHRGAQTASDWSGTLGSRSALRVVEPGDGDALTRGCVYVAPSDRHMTFQNGHVSLDSGPKEHHTRPAANPLFVSAAHEYGSRVLGVVLTGGGHDGMQGLREVTAAGGLSLVQKPEDSRDPSMPQHAIAGDHVLAALTLDELGDAIVDLALGRAVEVSSS